MLETYGGDVMTELGVIAVTAGYTHHGVCHNDSPPGRIHRKTVGQHLEEPFNNPEPPVGLRDAQAKPAACRHRPRANVPKLRSVLRSCDPAVSTLPQDPKGVPDCGVLWVSGFQETKQDARVGEDEHQSWSRYTSAREKSAGRWGKAGPDA